MNGYNDQDGDTDCEDSDCWDEPICDACPNPVGTDGDGDGVDDACDNCPTWENADQTD